MIEIPELEFEIGMGALGGKFTTLEGLLKDIQALVSESERLQEVCPVLPHFFQ